MKPLVVVPTYNERENIRPLVKAVIIILKLTSALQAFREQSKAGWHPNAVTSVHQVSK